MNKENIKTQTTGRMKNLPFLSTLLLVGLLAIVLFSVIGAIADKKIDDLFPQARAGVINLNSIDMNRSSSVPLSGNWHFYWEKLLSYNDLLKTNNTQELASVPHIWADMPTANDQSRTFGYATYKLTVKVPKNTHRLALRIPSVGTAYRLYINDKLLSAGGDVGKTEQTASPAYKVGIFAFDVPADSFDIIVQVSNFDLSIWGGLWEDLRLGNPAQLHLEQSRKNFRSTFIIAMFLTIAAFNLIQFSLRTLDPAPFIISVICIFLAAREIENSRLFAYMDIYYLDFATSMRISFITFYACAPFLIGYFYLTFKQEYNKWAIYSIFAISGAFSFSVLVASPTSFSLSIPYFQMLSIGFLAYMTWGLILAVIRKRANANMIFLGTLVLFSLICNDMLISLRIIDGVSLINFGLVALIMCQNYATYSRFIVAGEENKHLSIELSERNTELEQFSKSLEDLVTSRTSELSTANQQLEILAFNDSLTSVLNRRGLLQYIKSAKHKFETDHTPFCLLLIDFDNFKKLNDTLGHEVGDKVLVLGSQKMTSAVREQDNVGRWGGEEFLILLNDTTISEAKDIAQGVRVVIAELVTQSIGSKVTISIGVSEFTAEETIEKSINRADEALYRAKDLGRNRVALAE